MNEDEGRFLASCYLDSALIDKAVAGGVTRDHFHDVAAGTQWDILLELRAAGQGTETADVYAAAVSSGRLDKAGGLAGITNTSGALGAGTSISGGAYLSSLLSGHARRAAWKLLNRGKEMVEGESADLAVVGKIAEDLVAVCAGKADKHRSIDDINTELEEEQRLAKEGKRDESKLVKWGIPKADRYMLPIQPHEVVMICARPGVGKSSMMSHLAVHNLLRGLRVVYLTLETSDKAVLKQMAGQRAGVNLAIMREWMPEHHRLYSQARAELTGTKRLLILDNVLSLDAIAARCRLIAQSFRPDVVFWDYMGLTGVDGGSQYERVTMVSNRLIGIRKSLGCSLIVANQLNRGKEGTNDEPTSSSMRDSGHCEQDAHRIVIIHWKDAHLIDQMTRPYKLLQTKCRDGVVTSVDNITFHAPTTRFLENAS